MGTNVYVKFKPTPKELLDKIDLYNKTKYTKFLYDFLDKFNNFNEENTIHIGKRSGGWKFLFNHNNWKYYDWTRESINEFLKSCDRIYDEYDENLTVEEFWRDFVDSNSDGIDGEEYYTSNIKLAEQKEKGEIKDPFIGTVEQENLHYIEAKNRNFHEEYNCKGQIIPKTINYRFSNSTEFS